MESHNAAEYTEDDVGLPLNVVERRCDEVSQRKVEDPISRGR